MADLLVEVIAGGVAHTINDGTFYGLMGWVGLGMAPATRLTNRSPMQDGVSDVGFRLTPRRFALRIDLRAGSFVDHFTRRQEITSWFKPTVGALTIRITEPSGAVRCIDCHVAAGLGFDSASMVGFEQEEVVELVAPTPVFYDPTGKAQVFALGGGGAFAVPMAVPVSVGASTIDSVQVISYVGTWKSEPVVRIVGPLTNPVITNVTTGEVLSFNGFAIAGGDYYEIDTRFGRKTVKDSAGVSQIAKLLGTSDLATFHIAPDWEAVGGANSFHVTGSGAAIASSVTVYWNDKFIAL